MRLIDVDELIDRLEAIKEEFIKLNPFGRVTMDDVIYLLHLLIEKINGRPTIEAEPVRHGEWVIKERGVYLTKGDCVVQCNKCGHNRVSHREEVLDFCPKCGAKMDAK